MVEAKRIAAEKTGADPGEIPVKFIEDPTVIYSPLAL
jgi:hypothetical protein